MAGLAILLQLGELNGDVFVIGIGLVFCGWLVLWEVCGDVVLVVRQGLFCFRRLAYRAADKALIALFIKQYERVE